MPRPFALAVSRIAALALTLAGSAAAAPAPAPAAVQVSLPQPEGVLRFLVLGDSGTGDDPQYELGRRMVEARQQFPFELALMLGDNIYGQERPKDFIKKFEAPYKPLLAAGVKFYAALGNHDDPAQRFYAGFNMGGLRYYSFAAPRQSVRFFALDSNYMDPAQLAWLEKELQGTKEDWRIAYFHHPLYSSGKRHGPDVALRQQIEPIFVRHGVDLILAGHEHFYERIKPQNGIYHFISGGAAKLREGGLHRTGETEKGWAETRTFMLMAIAGDDLWFQTVDINGRTIDQGQIHRPGAPPGAVQTTRGEAAPGAQPPAP